MLHCNMKDTMTLQLSLDDLLADLRHARRQDDLGRLALVAYCEARRWARQAGEQAIAEHSAAMFTAEPHASREAFLAQVDELMFALEQARARLPRQGAPGPAPAPRAGAPADHGARLG